MADGLNHARAMRITEVMTDFRNMQHYIASIRVASSAEDQNTEGYMVLRQCVQDAQQVLASPFSSSAVTPEGDVEQEKTQLRQVLMDATLRRFRLQKVYMRTTAALRWINARKQILQGSKPEAKHAAALSQITHVLRNELSSITDARTELTLRSSDAAAGKWLAEDPSLAMITQMLRPR